MNSPLTQLQEKLGKGKSTIGLQISPSTVSAVQTAVYKGRMTIIKTASENIVPSQGNENLDLLPALRTVLSRFLTRQATVICAIHHPQVLVRKITTPLMPLDELGPAVVLAVRNFFPFSLDDAAWNFHVANKSMYQGKERLNIVVAACPRKVLETIQAAFTARGADRKQFKPLSVRVSSFVPSSIALENLAGRIQSKADETLVIIELGAAASELNMYRNGRLEFSRKLSVTGHDITQSMTGALYSDTGKTELTLQEAQEVKNEFGIPKPNEAQPVKGKLTAGQVLLLIRPQIGQLVTEINQAFDYYRGELRGGKIERVLLFGEEAQLKRLDEFLSDELGLEVRRGNPLEGVALLDPSLIPSDADAQKLVSAVGAALSNIKGVNLLSREPRVKIRWKIKKNILRTTALAATMVTVLMYLALNHQIEVNSERLRLKKKEFAAQLKKVRHGLAIRQLMQERPSWGNVLGLVSNLPSNMHFSELNVTNNQLNIKGVIVAAGEDPKLAIARFISDLRNDVLKDARLMYYKEDQEIIGRSDFEVVANIRTVR